jgi:hypothetical protein
LVVTLRVVLRILLHTGAEEPDQEDGWWLLVAREELTQAFPRVQHP